MVQQPAADEEITAGLDRGVRTTNHTEHQSSSALFSPLTACALC